ncbi:MAG: GNAT family N-acetyltransferase [Gammaproteobacteria bacterium]
MIAVEVVSGIASLERWLDDWERLFSSGRYEPSTSYEWTAALLRSHRREGRRVHLLILKEQGEIVGLVPLVADTDHLFGLPLITVRPLSELYDTHSDFLIQGDADAGIAAVLDALDANSIRWDVFRVSRLVEHLPITEAFERLTAARDRPRRIQYTPPSFYLELPASMHAYLAQRSGKFRNHLKRTEKKLLAQGEVEFGCVAGDTDIEQAYQDILHVESNSWKHAHGTAISTVAHQSVFYKELCLAAARTNRLHLSFLRLNGEPVAYNLGYFHDHRYAYLKTSYHEAYRDLGIATYSRAQLIGQVIGQGGRYFDFPGEPYEWEQQWTKALRWHRSITLFNRTPSARAFHFMGAIKRRFNGAHDDSKILEFCDARALRPPRA